MAARNYAVTITGKTPILMHNDNLDWADQMEEWRANPENTKKSKAGDDRTPAWRWLGAMYHDDNQLVIPCDNITTCLMEGATMVPVPGGKGGKSFKAQSQSGIITGEPVWTLLQNGKPIPVEPVLTLRGEESFSAQKLAVAKLGFMLFVKRAKISAARHIRVRPRFDAWSLAGTLIVTDDMITQQLVSEFFNYAGRYKGLGDWRPGNKKPGPHGMFTATVKQL